MCLVFGIAYKWRPSYLTINVGDIVHWTWQSKSDTKSIKYKVQQVDGPTSTNASGFDSGEPTSPGSFTYQFNTPGIYYYWSDIMAVLTGFEKISYVSFRGVVEVAGIMNKKFDVTVTQGDIEGK